MIPQLNPAHQEVQVQRADSCRCPSFRGKPVLRSQHQEFAGCSGRARLVSLSSPNLRGCKYPFKPYALQGLASDREPLQEMTLNGSLRAEAAA
jgi:hypothetical protein